MGKFLEKHKKLNYLQRTFRRRKNTEFVNDVMDMDKNPSYIKICNEEKANGKIVYVCETMGCDGFFAELRFILHEIYFADKYGFVPVATMPACSCYAEKVAVNGSENPFEYFFKPVSNVDYKTAKEENAFVRHNWVQRRQIEKDSGMIENNYLITDKYIETIAYIVNKYLAYNDQVDQYIAENVKDIIDKKVLGVHVRGADFKRGYKNHPFMVTTDEYLQMAKQAFDSGKFDKVFLATDDKEAIDKFTAEFSENLIFFEDVVRTDGDETVMKSIDERELHHYKLGLEVIRDMHALSVCSGLIAGMSNVSIFARILKTARKDKYDFIKIIDKGIKK